MRGYCLLVLFSACMPDWPLDTPGFGEAVDNSDCWQPILEYVEDQFDEYLEAETRVERTEIPDTR